MTIPFGSQSMIAPLRKVMVRRPDQAFAVDDPALWHYTDRPNLSEAQEEHDALVVLLRQSGAEILYHDAHMPDHADAVFVYDPVIISDRGAIILRMGKRQRRGEERAMAAVLESKGIPIHYTLHGSAHAEGGDTLWIDKKTLVVGQGFRTNAEGHRQIREAFHGQDVEVLAVDLPYYGGPDACLHLMSFISIVDRDLALVYLPLMPVPLWRLLDARGFRMVEVPEGEYATMASNVLALSPGKCLMLAGNPITKRRLETAGCQVLTYKGDEISMKAEGGPTCLTRPIWRE